MTAHTPTPWKADGPYIIAAPIVHGSIGHIAACYEREVEELYFDLVDAPLPCDENAAHIVRCVNAWDSAEALRARLAELEAS